MKIGIVGTGYVGLVTGTCLADVGHSVVCVDVDVEKIKLLQDGISPIYEPGLDELIKRNASHDRLTFTTDLNDALKDSDAIFIAVGTPEGEDGSADLGYVMAVAQEIAEKVERDLLVVVKSTVPVGTCDKVEQRISNILKDRGSKVKVDVGSNPEFLKEGTAIQDFRKPDRIVCGVAVERAASVFAKVYEPFIMDDPGKLLMMDRRSSELTKYGANSMLATRISFMNEMARLCEKVGANVDNVRRGMGSDPRIGRKFLYSGPGYGGSCFPKDVQAMRRSGQEYGVDLTVLDAVTKANLIQKQYVSDKITRHYGPDIKGKVFGVWGLAFKPGTDDVRETPANTIIDNLLAAGAKVKAHDPKAIDTYKRNFGTPDGLEYVKEAYDALEGADALVLVTEWSEYRRPNWEKAESIMRGRSVFDFRNQYNGDELIARGYHYECVGRPDSNVKG